MTINYREILTLDALLDNFPSQQYAEVRPNQRSAFEHIAKTAGPVVLELPVGSGKTAVGYTVLKTLAKAGVEGPLFYIVPNKALVDQVHAMHPDTKIAYGRNEYDCLYYQPEDFYMADEVPCLSLDCAHRVDQTTGRTVVEGVRPCPYYQAKFRAKQADIVVCTASWYLYNQLFRKDYVPPAGLVIDEVHGIADVFRRSLSYDITDWHLARSVKLMRSIGAEDQANQLEGFMNQMVAVLKGKSPTSDILLNDDDLMRLMNAVSNIDASALSKRLSEGIRDGSIDPLKERELLTQLESITMNLRRYIRSFEYSLESGDRHALNYVTYAYPEKEFVEETEEQRKRVQYRLIVRGYYVAPLIRRMLSPLTIAYSGTIGDPEILEFESGVKGEFLSLPSQFPTEHTRVMLPLDTPNLATKYRSKSEPTRVLRRIARACNTLQAHGMRSVLIVVSNVERDKFLRLCKEERVLAVSNQDGMNAREAMAAFKSGHGTVLVGTAANYGEGIDLPDGMAPVVFFLRPDYPNPYDPQTQFEERRFGNKRWQVWKWRQMIRALQVRGRNVRSIDDKGVTIFVSQQFREYLFGSLPEWLRDAYRRDLDLNGCIKEAVELME